MDNKTKETYEFIEKVATLVKKYAPLFDIKVHSPIIAQAVIESAKGKSDKVYVELVDGSKEWRHNYFGLKWRNNRCAVSNEYFEETTKEQRKDGSTYTLISKFFKFNSLEDCVLGYFQWTNNATYKNLKGVTNPREYIENIKADGYATSLTYVEDVMAVIERYNLTVYDEEEKKMAKRVCIDPGHFKKYNRSPGVPAYYESEMNWKLSNLQKKYLEDFGIEVILTKKNLDDDPALQTRGKMSAGCDLFISNHSNAVGNVMNESIDYAAVYHLTDDTATLCDDVSKSFASKIGPVIASVMGLKQGYKILTRKASSDRNNDGVMNDNYYGVLHGARMVNTPGLILEHSFHTNTRSANWLLSDDNLDLLARKEAICIAEFLGVELKEDKPATPSTEKKKLYRVQVGAFSVKANADKLKKELNSKGYEAIIVEVDV